MTKLMTCERKIFRSKPKFSAVSVTRLAATEDGNIHPWKVPVRSAQRPRLTI